MEINLNVVYKDFKLRISTEVYDSIKEALNAYGWIYNYSLIKIKYISIYVDGKPTTYKQLRVLGLLMN